MLNINNFFSALKEDLKDHLDRALSSLFGVDDALTMVPQGIDRHGELELEVSIGHRRSRIFMSKNMWEAIGQRAGWIGADKPNLREFSANYWKLLEIATNKYNENSNSPISLDSIGLNQIFIAPPDQEAAKMIYINKEYANHTIYNLTTITEEDL